MQLGVTEPFGVLVVEALAEVIVAAGAADLFLELAQPVAVDDRAVRVDVLAFVFLHDALHFG